MCSWAPAEIIVGGGGGGGKRKKGPHMVKKVPHNEKNVAKNAPNIAPIFFSVGRPSTLVPHPCRRL